MSREEKLAYDESPEEGRFREQFRLAFAGLIIATVFVVPDLGLLTNFLKLFLGISAFLSALFLIMSAARVKYVEPGYMYVALYVTERSRMRMFDWSVDVFGFAFFSFISLVVTGFIEKIFNIKFSEFWAWIVVIGILLIEMVVVAILSHIAKSRESKKKIPEI